MANKNKEVQHDHEQLPKGSTEATGQQAQYVLHDDESHLSDKRHYRQSTDPADERPPAKQR